MATAERPIEVREKDEIHVYKAEVSFITGYALPQGVWKEAVARALRDTKVLTVHSLVECIESVEASREQTQ